MTSRLLIFSLLILSAFLLAACGGGGAGNEDARLVDQYGLSLDVIEGSGAQYALSVQEAETVLVEVRVENAVEMTRSYVELKYDAELITPLRVMDGGFLGADTLFLQVTDRAGKVPVVAARTGADPEGVSGNGIMARIEFGKGAFPGRTTSSCPGRAKFVSFELDQDQNTILVNWTDDNTGDSNSDGHINGNDVFPIAIDFGKDASEAIKPCADANGDGTVDGMDIFPIATKFDMRYSAYNVYWDFYPTMDDAGVPVNDTPIAVDYNGDCRGQYSFLVGPLPEDYRYYIGITTLDGTVEGDYCVSEEQVIGSPNDFIPAINFTAENYGTYVFLDWDKPDTPERVRGYHVFRQPPLGSFEDISGKISGTQFDDTSISTMDTGDYIYQVVVEYDDEVMSDPTSPISVHWERTNNEPWINEVTTSNFTLDATAVETATLHVDGDDGEGGDNITWTWTLEQGHGTFPGGATGETVTFETSATAAEKVIIRVTGDDGTTPCTETIRLVFTTLPRVKIGNSGPDNGYFVDFDLEYLLTGQDTAFSDFLDKGTVVLVSFWRYS